MKFFLHAVLLLWVCSFSYSVELKKSEPSFPICSNNLKTRDIAQITIESDLMNEVLDDYKVKSGLVGVAVLDTGFDLGSHKSNMVSSGLIVEKGFDKSGIPTLDSSGHGTMVAGVIGGKNGMGVAPRAKLAVYRVTDDLRGSSNTDILQAAARKACDAGYSIINMSWGSVVDEGGFERGETREKKFIQEMQEKGCLIVKAAGNSSYRKKFPENDLDDAYLRVGSVMGSGGLSPFSSLGEVYAPGSSVFTLESRSPGYEPKSKNEYTCYGSAGVLVNGTSFSAPLTAGIAANIVALLRTIPNSGYEELPPSEKIKLLNRILSASEHRGSISGFRAAKIAEIWAKLETCEVPSAQELRNSLKDSFRNHCQADKNEVNARKKLSLCFDHAPNLELSYQAWKTFAGSKNVELALRYLRELSGDFLRQANKDYKRSQEMKELATALYSTLLTKWGVSSDDMRYAVSIWGVDIDEAVAFLPLYFLTGLNKTLKEFHLLKIILLSRGFEERFSRRELRGSEEDLNRLMDAFSLAQSFQPTENLIATILEAYERKFHEYYKGYAVRGTFLLGLLRLTEGLLTVPSLSSKSKELLSLEWDFFTRSNKADNIEVEKTADPNPSYIDLYFFSDLNHFQTAYLDGFFERHSKDILALLTEGKKWTPERLNAFFIPYLLKSKTFLDGNSRTDLALEVLDRIAKFRSWNRMKLVNSLQEDLKIGEYALEVLAEKWHLRKNAQLKTRYRQIFSEATNPDFIMSQLETAMNSNYYLDYLWSKTFEKNPFVDRDLIHFTARKFLALMPLYSQAMKIEYAYTLARLVNTMASYLADDYADLKATLNLVGGQWVGYAAHYARTFPDYFTVTIPTSNRLNPEELKSVKLGWMKPVSLLVSEVLMDWSQLAFALDKDTLRFSYWLWVFEVFGNNKLVCSFVQPTKEWRESVEEVKRKAEKESNCFGYRTYMAKLHADFLLKGCRH